VSRVLAHRLRLKAPGPAPAALSLAGIGAAALLIDRLWAIGVLASGLLVLSLQAPARGRWPYLYGALTAGFSVFLLSPLFNTSGGGTLLWEGPTLPVVGTLDVTTDELQQAALSALRLTALALAFAAYALLLDHDRLVSGARVARRSALAVALATRLVPTLQRDAAGLVEAVRGRGVAIGGVRGFALLLSPLVAGSLERATNLAEAMEARGFGRAGATRAPQPPWTGVDWLSLASSAALVAVSLTWL
jgi:energy-coupling factor transporter transmembrane protein EcfT